VFVKLISRLFAAVALTTITATAAAAQAGGPPLSGRDTVRAQIGGANIWIDYGRPKLRGRDVFVKGVLGDTLWRTGANAATQFRTDKDLLVDGKRLKAGTYTLYTRISGDNSKYALIFNAQTGQWGTEYHADRDVLSVPLRVTRAPILEEFTISIDPTSPASMLTLAWGVLRLQTRVEGAP
jgi:hypothetical protein